MEYDSEKGLSLLKKGKKGLLRMVFSRAGIITVLLLIQFGVLIVWGLRFSEYLPEKEVGEQIMRLRQFYDVGYYEATYNVKNQVFYFNLIEDNKTLVRVFPLEDYRRIDPDMKMDTYNLGAIYVKEDNGTLLKNEDDVFKYIPAECDCNVVYSKEPIFVETKPVPYYEDEETEEVSS